MPTSEGVASTRPKPGECLDLRMCTGERGLHLIDRPHGRHWTLGGPGSDLVHPANDMEAEVPGTEVAQGIVHDAPTFRVELGGELEERIADTKVKPVSQVDARRLRGQLGVRVLEGGIAPPQQEIEHRAVERVAQLLRVEDVRRDN